MKKSSKRSKRIIILEDSQVYKAKITAKDDATLEKISIIIDIMM